MSLESFTADLELLKLAKDQTTPVEKLEELSAHPNMLVEMAAKEMLKSKKNEQIFTEIQKTQLNHTCGHSELGLSENEMNNLVRSIKETRFMDLENDFDNPDFRFFNKFEKFIIGDFRHFFIKLTNSPIDYDSASSKFVFDYIIEEKKMTTIDFLKWFPCILDANIFHAVDAQRRILIPTDETIRISYRNKYSHLYYQMLFLIIVKIVTNKEEHVLHNPVNPLLLWNNDKFDEFIKILEMSNTDDFKDLSLDLVFELNGLPWTFGSDEGVSTVTNS